MNSFITIFEISKDNVIPYPNMFPLAAGAVGIGIALLIALFIWRKKHIFSLKKLYIPLFLILWGSLTFLIVGSGYKLSREQLNELILAYGDGKYQITEGVVHVVHEQPKTGHTKGDIIKIDDKTFEINFYGGTSAYSQTIAHGGVLREGVYARLYHYKGKIIRVDIRKDERYAKLKEQSDLISNDESNGTPIGWKDYIWISCIFASNILFYARKAILTRYGYGFFPLDLFFEDRGRLKSIAKSEVLSTRRRYWYNALNNGIPFLFLSACIIIIWVRVIPGVVMNR